MPPFPPPLVAHCLKGKSMCEGKTNSEVKRSCSSSCKNFARCAARILALDERLLEADGSLNLDNRHPPVPTTSRTMLAVVGSTGSLSFA